MNEASKIIIHKTGLKIYASASVIFLTSSKYVIQVGEFVILRDFVLSTWGFRIYLKHKNTEIIKGCFDNKKENYKKVIEGYTDDIIFRLTRSYLNVGTDFNLYMDQQQKKLYQSTLNLKK